MLKLRSSTKSFFGLKSSSKGNLEKSLEVINQWWFLGGAKAKLHWTKTYSYRYLKKIKWFAKNYSLSRFNLGLAKKNKTFSNTLFLKIYWIGAKAEEEQELINQILLHNIWMWVGPICAATAAPRWTPNRVFWHKLVVSNSEIPFEMLFSGMAWEDTVVLILITRCFVVDDWWRVKVPFSTFLYASIKTTILVKKDALCIFCVLNVKKQNCLEGACEKFKVFDEI